MLHVRPGWQRSQDPTRVTSHGQSQDATFLGIWRIAGSTMIPPFLSLRKIEWLQMPQSRKELQQLMGTSGYWKKRLPGISIIAHPFYLLLQKGKPWELTLQHRQARKTLKN